jgi:hypothetical protein
MNHPTREQWMSYLYDELSAEEHSSLAAHLAVCPDCKSRLSDWRSARRSLDAWQLPLRPARVALQRPLLRWAAAAALIIGIGVGRFAMPATANVGKIRAAIEPEIRQQLLQELTQLLRTELDRTASATLAASGEQAKRWVEDYAQALEGRRTEESRAVYTALNTLKSQHLADFVSLKKDVDTVAVLTDAGLRRAQQQLVQLADYTQPASNSNSPQN